MLVLVQWTQIFRFHIKVVNFNHLTRKRILDGCFIKGVSSPETITLISDSLMVIRYDNDMS